MDLGLADKVALVAAASSGLGRAIAEELATEGAHLVICARDGARLQQVRDAIAQSHGVSVSAVTADVGVPQDVERLVAQALEEHGRVDVLVTNNGGPPDGGMDAFGPDDWEDAFRLILQSAVELSRRVLPGMKERGFGRILNVTSIAAKQPVDRLILSNSLRAGVLGFARTLANEVAAHGITVNNLLPGFTRTQRLEDLAAASAAAEGLAPTDIYARWAAQIPAGRIGEPQEFAALAAFLASERASYITGASIAVDGGWIRSLL
ncbi:MAG: SDR family oxidoreductase [Planctomycetota bacterium]